MTNFDMFKSRGLALVAARASWPWPPVAVEPWPARSSPRRHSGQDHQEGRPAQERRGTQKVKDGTLKLADLDKKANDTIKKGGPADRLDQPARLVAKGPGAQGPQGPQGPRATPAARPTSARTGASSTATSSGTAMPSCDLALRSGNRASELAAAEGHRQPRHPHRKRRRQGRIRRPGRLGRHGLSTINTVKYSVFTTGENVTTDTENLPGAVVRDQPQPDGRHLLDAELRPRSHRSRLESAGRQFGCPLVVLRR